MLQVSAITILSSNGGRGNALEILSRILLVTEALGLTECYLQQQITVWLHKHERGMRGQ